MKKALIMVIIVAILVAICVGEEIMVSNSVNTVKENCQALYNIASNGDNVNTEEIISLSNKTVEFWKKREHELCFYINYKDMGEMTNELIRVQSYAKENIKEEFITSLSLVIYYCNTFDHITGFNFQNIF